MQAPEAPSALPGGCMRRFLPILLLTACVFAQSPARTEGPDFSRGARPRGSFYLNGVGHQYLQGTNFTVIAAAIPVLNGRFFGVKVHVINRGTASVDVVPESITADDSVGAKQLALLSSAEVNDKLQRPSGWMRVAGMAAGEPMAGASGGGNSPNMTDLLRELMKEASAESPWAADATPTLTPRGAARATA